jgi:hypothetical protein
MNSITTFYELMPSTTHRESCLTKDLDAAVCSGRTAAGGPSEGSWVTTSGLPGSAFLRAGTHNTMTAAAISHKIQCPTVQKCSQCSDWARGGPKIFSSKSFSPALGSTQPPFQWALEAEQQGHELNCSLPSIAEAKSGWSCTSTPLVCLYGEDKGNCIFTLSSTFTIHRYPSCNTTLSTFPCSVRVSRPLL